MRTSNSHSPAASTFLLLAGTDTVSANRNERATAVDITSSTESTWEPPNPGNRSRNCATDPPLRILAKNAAVWKHNVFDSAPSTQQQDHIAGRGQQSPILLLAGTQAALRQILVRNVAEKITAQESAPGKFFRRRHGHLGEQFTARLRGHTNGILDFGVN